MYICLYLCGCVCVSMYVYVYVCMYICMCMCMYVYIYIYIYINIYIYIYVYVYEDIKVLGMLFRFPQGYIRCSVGARHEHAANFSCLGTECLT